MKPSESICSSFIRHMPAETLLAEIVPVRSGCSVGLIAVAVLQQTQQCLMNDSRPLLLDYKPNSHTRCWLILSGSWWSYLRNRSSQTVHASEWELVSHVWKSPMIIWPNMYFLFLILLCLRLQPIQEVQGTCIQPHSFKCKSHMKWTV